MDSEDLHQRTHDTVVRIDDRLGRFEERFDRVETTLYGNGQPGLTTQVSLLKAGASRSLWRSRAFITSTLSFLVAVLVYMLGKS